MNPPLASAPLEPLVATRHELLQTQLAEISKLAGGLAHEIRNPLSTIGLNLELLEEDLTPGESPRDRRMLRKVQTIRKECAHLEKILESFLQFSRPGCLETQLTDLNEVIQEFVDFFQAESADRQMEIRLHLAASLPKVQLDRRLWKQVLANLARNATEAMPDGGTLEFLTYLSSSGEQVILELIDTGKGMDATTQQRMFDAFFSTRAGGSGLGLPTVRKIVMEHGGRVECESAVGRGTRFRILLPACTETTSERP